MAALAISAPQQITVPLGHGLTLELLTSGLSRTLGDVTLEPSTARAVKQYDQEPFEYFATPRGPHLGFLLRWRMPF